MIATPKKAHNFERADHEWYVDPPSCADALFRVERFEGLIFDPCCGMGNIVRMAEAHGYRTWGADISGRFPQWRHANFFKSAGNVENIVFNPPYGKHPEKGLRLEERAIIHARRNSRKKVAALLRLQWMACRVDWLKEQGCVRIWALSPRPSMLPGVKIVNGEMPKGGVPDYAWYVFEGDDPSKGITIDVAKRDRSLDTPEAWYWRTENTA